MKPGRQGAGAAPLWIPGSGLWSPVSHKDTRSLPNPTRRKQPYTFSIKQRHSGNLPAMSLRQDAVVKVTDFWSAGAGLCLLSPKGLSVKPRDRRLWPEPLFFTLKLGSDGPLRTKVFCSQNEGSFFYRKPDPLTLPCLCGFKPPPPAQKPKPHSISSQPVHIGHMVTSTSSKHMRSLLASPPL